SKVAHIERRIKPKFFVKKAQVVPQGLTRSRNQRKELEIKGQDQNELKDLELSKSHLIKDCHVYDTVDNVPSVVSKAASIPAGSRNSSASTSAGRSIPVASRNKLTSIHAGRSIPAASRNISASIHAGRSIPAASRNRSTSIHAGRSIPAGRINKPAPFPAGSSVPTGWTNPTARSFFGPINLYSDNVYWLGIYDYMSMNEGRWGSAVKSSADIDIVDSGCSRSMTGNKEKLDDFVQVKGGTITFGGGDGKITGKEAVSTACYVLNRVFITNPHNKTSYELLSGKVPNIRHLKPFGCQVIILNTSKHFGNFEGKANDSFLVGYAAHNKPNVQGLSQEWYFDLDYLTDSLGYTRFKTNPPAGTHDTNILAGTQANDSESECDERVILVSSFPSNSFSGSTVHDVSAPMENNLDYAEELARLQRYKYEAHSVAAKHGFEFSDDTAALLHQAAIETRRNLVLAARDLAGSIVSTGGVPAGSVPASGVPVGYLPTGSVPASGVPAGSLPASIVSTGGVPAGSVPASGIPVDCLPTSSVPAGGIIAGSIDSAKFGVPAASESIPAVFSNDHAATSPLPPGHSLGSCEHTTRFPSPSDLGNHQPIAGIFSSSSYDDDFCANVTNLDSNVAMDPVATKRLEPSSVAKALEDPDWVAAMQEEMQQLYHQQVWKLVPLPVGKIAIGTKWILKNKKDARGIVVRNKARLVAQGHRQEEGTNYDEVFALVSKIEAIQLFLAFASYMGFMVYQMDVKSAFLYREIEEEVYVTQPKGLKIHTILSMYTGLSKLCMDFIKHQGPDGIIFSSTNKAWCDEFEVLMKCEFEMSAMGELTFFLGLQVKQLPDGIFISQDKYVKDMLKKFDTESVRTATTPYEVPKYKSKDDLDDAVNVHLFRSMIGSLMYLTASRPDIMFTVSACSRHQVTPLTSHLNAVEKIFKYLKGQPNLGLWYPRDSPFQLEAYSDSDYAGSHGDRKSTTGGFAVVRSISYSILVYCWMNAVSCGLLLYSVSSVSRFLMQRVVQLLVHAVDLVPASSCIIPTGRLLLVYADEFVPAGHCTFATGSSSFIQFGLVHTVVPSFHLNGGIQTTDPSLRPTFDFTAKLFSNMKLNWDRPHMPLLATMLVVPVARDGADAVVAGAAVAPDVLPPSVPLTHSSSSIPGPSSAPHFSPVREPSPVKELTPRPVREPNPNSPRPPFPPPRSEEVGPITSTRPPSPTRQSSFHADISKGGGDFFSSPKSNEAPPTPAATAAGGAEDSVALTALSLKLDRFINRVTSLENELGITKKVLSGVVLKLVTRVKWLEGLLQQRKQRLVLYDYEGKGATPTKQDIDLEALHTLASTSLGGDSSDKAAGHDATEVPADTTMPFCSTSTTRRHLKKLFTSSASAHVPDNIPAGVGIPAAATTIPAGSSMDAAVHSAAAPSSSIPAVDKGKAPMVDDSLPADLLSERPSLPDSKRSWHRRLKLNVLLHLLNTVQGCQINLLRDDVTKDNMNERLGMLLLRKRRELAKQRSTFRPKPTLNAPSAKRANQGVPQVPAASSQVLASVPTAPSFAADVSVSAATTLEFFAAASRLADTPTSSAHVSVEHSVAASTHSSLHRRRKHISKKQLTTIVDIADAALIKFDSDSGSDDDPLPGKTLIPLLCFCGEICMSYFSPLIMRMPMISGVIKTAGAFAARVYILVLSAATLERMLKHGLEVPKLLVGGDLTMAEQLVSFIKAAPQCSICCLILGGSLLKTTWSSVHHLLTNEVLTSPEQTAPGKDVSNPFMVVMVFQKPLRYSSSPMIHVPRAELVFNPSG
nr:retrovirus-related Pol polyprotein from transposon TNT 1-94 [Tanacetum cinerariifolium]